jgi:hypothetical protein
MQGDSLRGLQQGTWATFRGILSEQGPFTFWRGTQASVLRMGLGVGLHMVIVENLASRLSTPSKDGHQPQLSALNAAVAGGGRESDQAGRVLVICSPTLLPFPLFIWPALQVAPEQS